MRTPVAAALLCLALTGCNGGLFSDGQSGFVSGDGDVKVVARADREAPKPISGTTLDGGRVSLSDLEGKIVVMPIWGSWCGPCRAEAPMFQAAYEDLGKQGVTFLGVNVRDESEDNARAFTRGYDITYPSLSDPSGETLLSFKAGLTPDGIPSVAFIDEDGKVAAAVLGEITRTTLYDVIEEIRK